MWALIKSLLLQWAFFKVLLKSFGSLAFLLPIAFLLKMVGLPVLAVLGTLALPVLFVLAILGLPFLIVFVIGGILLGAVAMLLPLGLFAIKVILPIVLLVWFVRWVFGWGHGRDEKPIVNDPPPPATDI
jgi:hypothetical protein